MEKRSGIKGQIQLSFGMIFSVILIGITLFVAGYVTMNFVKTADCSKLGSFYKGIEGEVETVYQNNGETKKTLNALPSVPSKVSFVCFGSLAQNAADANDEVMQNYFIQRGLDEDNNLFFYPMQSSCEKKYASFKVAHLTNSEFFCVRATDGKVPVKITKDESTNLLVKLNK